jgi:hypothetical protein
MATLLGAIALGTIFFKSDPEAVIATTTGQEDAPEPRETSTDAAFHVSLKVPVKPLKPVRSWDFHKPLTTEEKKEFEAAEAQVQKFLTWGKMDPEAVPAFRQTLFKMGDRAIADIARGLSQVTKDDINDKADAEAIVHKIDVLGYFANSKNPLAGGSAAHLAKRPFVMARR